MNKKGVAVLFMTAIGYLIFVTVVSIYLYNSGTADVNNFVGRQPFNLVKQYIETEKDLMGIDLAAKYSSYLSVHELAQNGGHISDSCGEYLNYKLWNNAGATCYPSKDSAEANLGKTVTDNMGDFTSLDTGSYTYSFDSSNGELRIVGIAKEPFQQGSVVSEGLFDNVRVTRYYTPRESDFDKWYSGADPKKYRNYDSGRWCAIDRKDMGFYEAVLCEGSGYGNDGRLYSYRTIKTTKEQSPPSPTPTPTTSSGNPATTHRTIAVAPDMIPLGTRVKITFKSCSNQALCDQWNGEYAADDTGPAMIIDWKKGEPHIDLYVGIGEQEYNAVSGLSESAIVEIIGAEGAASYTYTVSALPSFDTKIRYSLDEYDALTSKTSDLLGALGNCIGADNPKQCADQRIASVSDANFLFSQGCEKGNERAVSDFIEFYSDCLNAADVECSCTFGPEGNTDILLENKDQKGEETLITGAGLSHTIKSTGPLVLQGNIAAPQNEYVVSSNTKTTLYKQKGKVSFTGRTDLRKCDFLKQDFKVCAESKKNKVLILNGKTSNIENVPVSYRFALHVEKKNPPPPVENLNVLDKEKAEEQILLYWDESSDTSVASYQIYKSGTEFIPSTSGYRSVEGLTPVKEAKVQDITDANTYRQSGSLFTVRRDVGKAWYSVMNNDGTSTEVDFAKETPYKLTGSSNKIVYVIGDLIDNQKTYFTVVAVDRFGNKNVTHVTSASGLPKDDLSPDKPIQVTFNTDNRLSGKMPINNEDGITIEEVSLMADVYASESETCSANSVDFSQAAIASSTPTPPNSQFIIDLTGKLTKQKASGELIKYCIAAVARDEEGNAKYDDPAVKIVDVVGPVTMS